MTLMMMCYSCIKHDSNGCWFLFMSVYLLFMNKTCKKCGHLCHCIEADHEGCKCENCDCKEPEGMVIDDTNECEACQ